MRASGYGGSQGAESGKDAVGRRTGNGSDCGRGAERRDCGTEQRGGRSVRRFRRFRWRKGKHQHSGRGGADESPRIGESRAKAIIAYREENGKFESIEDIMKIDGIKEKMFDKIKNSITVS